MNKILLAKIDKAIALIARAEPVALRYRDFGMIVAFSGGFDFMADSLWMNFNNSLY